MSKKAIEGSVRDRLLGAASELFYEEGVHSVGIDRVIARAGVAKASLYSTFGSKDDLIVAYLKQRHAARQQRVATRLAMHTTPRARVLGLFDLLGEQLADARFRGCAFVRASAETHVPKVRAVCRETRDWMRSVFTELATEAGAADPDELGRRLVLLYDGAMTSGQMDRDPTAAATARAMAAALFDAATA
jgi:AcrR family transcriptional regulator